jgi:hypothetical protein
VECGDYGPVRILSDGTVTDRPFAWVRRGSAEDMFSPTYYGWDLAMAPSSKQLLGHSFRSD